MNKCEFCGAEEKRVKTPYLELNDKGEYVNKTTWCCNAQAKNQGYAKNRDVDPEEVSKW